MLVACGTIAVAGCASLEGLTGGSDAAGSDAAGLDAASSDALVAFDSQRGGEDCLNGVDDNGDGLIDCDDPACMPDFECVDALGGSPSSVTSSPYGGSPPAPCLGGTLYYDGLKNAAASCSTCTCGTMSGASCPLRLACSDNATDCSTSDLTDMACHDEAPIAGGNSCKVVAAVASQGTCTASGGVPTKPDPWAHQDELCPLPAGKCSAAGKKCEPRAACHRVR